MVTRSEVESIKNRLMKEEREEKKRLNNNFNINNRKNHHHHNNNKTVRTNHNTLPTDVPRAETEEQTNSIPVVPNYWIPVKQKGVHGE